MNIFTRIGVILLIALSSLSVLAEVPKPHAVETAQHGAIRVDQEGGFNGIPRDLADRDADRDPSHVVFGYHPYWNGTDWQDYDYSILSHIAWFGLAMGSTGNITNSNGWPVNGLVDMAHANGVKVIVTVTQFENSGIATLLANAAYRQTAIDNLLARVLQGNADGVNIDFEFVPTSSRSDFNIFIHDLTVAFHDEIPGSEVSIAMPSVDWWDSYDYNYLSDNSDGLMIMAYGYYWGGSSNAGPLSPLNSGLSSWYIRRTIEDYLDKTGNDGSQLILGLPWYGYNWPVENTVMGAPTTGSGSSIVYATAEANAQAYGKQYNTTAPSAWYNYTSGGPRQVWYDDSLSLASKYDYAKTMDIKGIGIWALGYDGGRSEIWGGLYAAFGATAPPLAPQYFSVHNQGNGSVIVTCSPTGNTDQYEAYTSTDGSNFSLTNSSVNPNITLDGLTDGQIIYVKIRNTNAYGDSDFSEVLGTVIDQSSTADVLIVQGFERTGGTVNNFDNIIQHGSAVYANGRIFDSASNDAVEQGQILLADYAIVDWISGEEATQTVSFSSQEQSLIIEYLESGGRIFISGSEIGWDLEANGSSGDINFYHNYFKADYITDDASSYEITGTAGGIFENLSGIFFDDGSHGTYDVDYPDGIKPIDGSVSNLLYAGVNYATNGGAGIQYLGGFGDSNAMGGIVYLGFGFETIYPESNRNITMERVLNFLDTAVAVNPEVTIPNEFQVAKIFPNPFNGSFTLPVQSLRVSELTLAIFNMKGQLMHQIRRQVQAGDNNLTLDIFNNSLLSSGIYLLRVSSGSEIHSQNITYIK